jgi:hypothetical protein
LVTTCRVRWLIDIVAHAPRSDGPVSYGETRTFPVMKVWIWQ